MKQNLATIIERAQAKGVVVILAGMEAPPNYGARVRERRSARPTAISRAKYQRAVSCRFSSTGSPGRRH